MRRALTISAIVIVLLGAGVGIYLYLSPSATLTVAPSGSSTLPAAGESPAGGSASTSAETAGTPTSVSARLVQVSAGPVVPGEVIVDTAPATASTSTQVSVRYIARESGNVFSYDTASGQITRINNKTIPGIQTAAWLPDGSGAFVRYLSGNDFSTINTYFLPATTTQGFFMPQDIDDIAVSSTSVLSLVSGVNGSSLSTTRPDGSRTTNLFSTPLTEVRALLAGTGKYLLFSKPSADIQGYAFLSDATGRLARISGPLSGLDALASPSGKWLLVSYTSGSALRMELVDTSSGTATQLPVTTIADKCVWAADESVVYCGVPANPPAATYPDDWYRGSVSFSDRIWKIDVTGRYAQLVLDFSQANKGTLDAVSLATDPAGTTLVFVNKNDGSLWSYSL